MKAELIQKVKGDVVVVNAARVSFNKQVEEVTLKDTGLINYLAAHGHWTPFAHARETFEIPAFSLDLHTLNPNDVAGMVWKRKKRGNYNSLIVRHSLWGWAKLITENKIDKRVAGSIKKILHRVYPLSYAALFKNQEEYKSPLLDVTHVYEMDDPHFIDITLRETIPIFVARQRFKHVVGFIYNEVSRRYVFEEPDFHVPVEWRGKPDGSIKQGSCEMFEEPRLEFSDYLQPTKAAYAEHLTKSDDLYLAMLRANIAPEMARMILPQSMETSFYVTGSLHAFATAYKQRIDSHAQKEIQDLAQYWDAIIRPIHTKIWSQLTNTAAPIIQTKEPIDGHDPLGGLV
jgi:thymidylate synthase (FAD)